jgi:hypothetical protein
VLARRVRNLGSGASGASGGPNGRVQGKQRGEKFRKIVLGKSDYVVKDEGRRMSSTLREEPSGSDSNEKDENRGRRSKDRGRRLEVRGRRAISRRALAPGLSSPVNGCAKDRRRQDRPRKEAKVGRGSRDSGIARFSPRSRRTLVRLFRELRSSAVRRGGNVGRAPRMLFENSLISRNILRWVEFNASKSAPCVSGNGLNMTTRREARQAST